MGIAGNPAEAASETMVIGPSKPALMSTFLQCCEWGWLAFSMHFPGCGCSSGVDCWILIKNGESDHGGICDVGHLFTLTIATGSP